MKPSVAIVGCGKVGTALALFLNRAGYQIVGLASKSLASAKRTARLVESDRFSDVPWEITASADVVFITTPDGAIADTCSRIAQNQGFADHAVILHCSGALPSTILSSAGKYNASTGSMHPLQSFAAVEYSTNPFDGIIISIEGEKAALDTAQKISSDLGGRSVTILTDAKMLYHASAVTASNYLVTLLNLAFMLIGEAGIADRDAFKVLKPLIDGTLANIEKVGIPQALTGPIARGDIETVERHVREIGLKAPRLLSFYQALGFHTIEIAVARGTISETSAQALRRILAVKAA